MAAKSCRIEAQAGLMLWSGTEETRSAARSGFNLVCNKCVEKGTGAITYERSLRASALEITHDVIDNKCECDEAAFPS